MSNVNTASNSRLFFSAVNVSRMRSRLQEVTPSSASTVKQRKVGAVLVPLVQSDGRPALLFTKRSRLLKSHSGEICFPGGGFEASDKSLVQTALREMEEEINICPSDVQIWGALNSLPTRDLSSEVLPVVGKLSDNFSVEDCRLSDEVEEVFVLPLNCLLESSSHTQFRSMRLSMPLYRCGPHHIWGFTAIILHLFFNTIMYAGHTVPFLRALKV